MIGLRENDKTYLPPLQTPGERLHLRLGYTNKKPSSGANFAAPIRS